LRLSTWPVTSNNEAWRFIWESVLGLVEDLAWPRLAQGPFRGWVRALFCKPAAPVYASQKRREIEIFYKRLQVCHLFACSGKRVSVLILNSGLLLPLLLFRALVSKNATAAILKPSHLRMARSSSKLVIQQQPPEIW
jgi:hypothetical protein